MTQTFEQAADTAVRFSAPLPVAVTGLSLYGVSMQDVVYILTAILTVLMVIEKLWSMWRKWKRSNDAPSE